MISTRAFSAFLFDMDGTLLDSVPASKRAWRAWAAGFGLDGLAILKNAHGMKVRDVIAGLDLPEIDVDRESDAILRAELEDVAGIQAVAGAPAFLASLPVDRWAVVTSAPRALALRRLAAAALPVPPVLVSAEDVVRGKPDPHCYRIAADRLGVLPDRCVAFEDAEAGITAAVGAGTHVVAVTAVQGAANTAGSHMVLTDYRGIAIEDAGNGEWRLAIT